MREVRRTLSPRQAEIAQHIVRAKSNLEIAQALSLSERTVEVHVAAIFSKLGVHSRIELVRALRGAGTKLLPPQHTRLVGRATEIDEILGSLAETRLLTLTGAGGVGKNAHRARRRRELRCPRQGRRRVRRTRAAGCRVVHCGDDRPSTWAAYATRARKCERFCSR